MSSSTHMVGETLAAMPGATKHIAVCICTYKRPPMLRRVIAELLKQETRGKFTFSIVVVDNDEKRSAEETVREMAATSPVAILYCTEPRQNIALARNKAVENAPGDFVAFIDDDEFPAAGWLLNMYDTCVGNDVDGVLGPVLRHFDETPPTWLIKSSFYTRPRHETGFKMHWHECRTGNLLLQKRVFDAGEPPFRQEFRAGEDQDFFRRKTGQGKKFIWCDEAPVYETVPPIRWDRNFMLRRALLRGATAVLHPTFGIKNKIKSLVAVVLYTVALPFAYVLGYHRYMSLLVRLCDHLGALLALVGMNPVKEQYVTEQ